VYCHEHWMCSAKQVPSGWSFWLPPWIPEGSPSPWPPEIRFGQNLAPPLGGGGAKSEVFQELQSLHSGFGRTWRQFANSGTFAGSVYQVLRSNLGGKDVANVTLLIDPC
jgi:hypothetical protein